MGGEGGRGKAIYGGGIAECQGGDYVWWEGEGEGGIQWILFYVFSSSVYHLHCLTRV